MAFAVNVKTIAPTQNLYQSGHAIWLAYHNLIQCIQASCEATKKLGVINVGGGMRGKRTVSCRNSYFGSHSYHLDTAVDKTAISR